MPRPVGRLLRTAAQLRRDEWLDLLLAQWLLLVTSVRLRLARAGGLLAAGQRPDGAGARPADRDAVVRAAWAVDRAVTFGPIPARCLARSLACVALLRRRGIPGAVVRVGVRPGEGTLAAHAWVEWGGRAVGEQREHLERFTVLRDLVVASRP